MLPGVLISRAETDADLEAVVAVRASIDPRIAPDCEQLRHLLGFWHEPLLLVARLDGIPAGCALAGIFPASEGERAALGDVSVVPAMRGRGIGSELHAAIRAHARSFEKESLVGEAREDDTYSITWLERRGYVEVERQKAMELDLGTLEPLEPELPPGIVLVTRAERPDLLEGTYDVAREANEDIPGLDSGFAWTFDEWKAFEVDRPSRMPELCFLALDGDVVVGFASVDVIAGNASNGLTGVRRSYRRRGIARALKRAQIRAAKAAGYPSLLTESEETNEPMRRLNESLGYRSVPGMIVFRGPLTAPIDHRPG